MEPSCSTWTDGYMGRHDTAKWSFKTFQTLLQATYLPPLRTGSIRRLVKDRMGLKPVSVQGSTWMQGYQHQWDKLHERRTKGMSEDWKFHSRLQQETFLFSKAWRLVLGATQPHWLATKGSFPMGKGAGAWCYPSPGSAKVKNIRSYYLHSPPPMPVRYAQGDLYLHQRNTKDSQLWLSECSRVEEHSAPPHHHQKKPQGISKAPTLHRQSHQDWRLNQCQERKLPGLVSQCHKRQQRRPTGYHNENNH